MAGNMCSICAVTCATSRYYRAPECRPAKFQDGNINNKDVVCPSCGVHQHRTGTKHKDCLFCGSNLGIKRGRPKLNLVYAHVQE